MPHPFHCPHCLSASRIVAPAPWTRVLLALAWIHAAVLVFCAAMLGPFMLPLVPVMFAFGGGLVSGAHALAGEPPTCARCEKIVLPEHVAAAPRPTIAAGLVRAA